jgi:hypothetical protein
MPRTVVKLGEDEYLEWSSVVDAPVTAILTRAEALATFPHDRVERADANGHSAMWCDPKPGTEFVRYNRAGPKESCLTVDAIRRRYRPGADDDPLRPEEIQTGVTSYANHPDIDPDRLFWVPWRPSEPPDAITDDTDLNAEVEMTPEEAERWRAEQAT